MKAFSLRSWWGRLALRAKTMVVAGIPLLVLVLAVPVLYSTQRSASNTTAEVEHTYRVRQNLATVLRDLVTPRPGSEGSS